MPENNIQFLPFHAINEFMRTDFRLHIVRHTLSNIRSLPEDRQENLNHLIKRFVKVPGFRHSEKAPSAIKVIPTAKAFESNPDLVAGILSAWKELHPDLSEQIFQVLKSRGWFFFSENIKSPSDLPPIKTEKDWGILPLEADRTNLPGFLIFWPKEQEFEAIYETFTQLFPDSAFSLDEVSLMAVWISNRLPYHIQEEVLESDQTRLDPDQTE